MSDIDRGTDRAGRRSKRLLSPLQKYEVWLHLVRQEVTIAEAATAYQVDRSTIMRIRTVVGQTRSWTRVRSRSGDGQAGQDAVGQRRW